MGEVRDGDVLTEQGEPRAVEVRDEENEEGGVMRALCVSAAGCMHLHVTGTPRHKRTH